MARLEAGEAIKQHRATGEEFNTRVVQLTTQNVRAALESTDVNQIRELLADVIEVAYEVALRKGVSSGDLGEAVDHLEGTFGSYSHGYVIHTPRRSPGEAAAEQQEELLAIAQQPPTPVASDVPVPEAPRALNLGTARRR